MSNCVYLKTTSRSQKPKFGQLILKKIIKIVANRCQILRLKCTKINFGWTPSQTPLGELASLPQTSSGNKGTYFKRKTRVQGGEGKERKGKAGERNRNRELPGVSLISYLTVNRKAAW